MTPNGSWLDPQLVHRMTKNCWFPMWFPAWNKQFPEGVDFLQFSWKSACVWPANSPTESMILFPRCSASQAAWKCMNHAGSLTVFCWFPYRNHKNAKHMNYQGLRHCFRSLQRSGWNHGNHQNMHDFWCDFPHKTSRYRRGLFFLSFMDICVRLTR